MSSTIRIAPSILAADFARLGDQVRQAEAAGADRLHLDVMDGHFVPNISFGPVVVKSIRAVTRLPLETHLMIAEPNRYLEAFAAAGSDSLLVHVEENPRVRDTIAAIRRFGLKAGVVVNPATPLAAVETLLPDVDLLLVMTVQPGFGGQAFMADALDKVRQARSWIAARHLTCDLEVDGGIDAQTAPLAVQAGANVLVAGTAVFGAADGIAAAMARLARGAVVN